MVFLGVIPFRNSLPVKPASPFHVFGEVPPFSCHGNVLGKWGEWVAPTQKR